MNHYLFQDQNPMSFCRICLIYQYFFIEVHYNKSHVTLMYFSKIIYLNQGFFYNHNVIITPNWLTIIYFIQYLMHYPNFPDYLKCRFDLVYLNKDPNNIYSYMWLLFPLIFLLKIYFNLESSLSLVPFFPLFCYLIKEIKSPAEYHKFSIKLILSYGDFLKVLSMLLEFL